MRRHEQEITDGTAIEEILNRALVCRIGLAENNHPYVVPVSFGYSNNCIYFHSSTFGRKMDILRNNNNVCFETEIDVEAVPAETACKWSVKYLSVIGFGKAQIVNDREEKIKGLNAIMKHYSGTSYHSYDEKALNLAAVIKIEIESMTGKKSKGE